MFGSIANLLRGNVAIGFFISRAALGLSMALSHGYGKFMDMQNFIGVVEKIGYPYPMVFGFLAASSEFIGGLLLALGLFTRGAALFLLATMLNAAFYVHRFDPFEKKEMAILYSAGFLLFLFAGPGRLSLDSFFRKVTTI